MKAHRTLALQVFCVLVIGIPTGYYLARTAAGVQGQPASKEPATEQDAGKPPPKFAAFDAPALPDCSKSHCHDIDDILYSICRQNHWDASVKVPTREPDPGFPQGKPCFCSCSCLAFNTQIATPKGRKGIQEFTKGDAVLVMSEDGADWVPAKVISSSGTASETTSVNYAIRAKIGDKILISNPDHLYMTKNKSLKRADRLKVGDELMSAKLTSVRVESVVNGTYQGGFYNIVTDAKAESTNGHLIDSEGIVSADYYLQQSTKDKADLLAEPQVGSPKYLAAVPNFLKDAADVKPESEYDIGFFPVGKDNAPPNARSFLPRSAERPDPAIDFRALDDGLTQLKAKQILNLWYGYYPEITYELDWNNNTVNAVAWVDASGRRHVKVYGGLVRHPAIRWEGMSLVVAHETGHHYGGAPYYPGSQLSCEGQADYWATLVGMRNVYPEEDYLAVVLPAIDQVYKLFTGGLVENQNSDKVKRAFDSNNCGHPPADCRKETYLAGVDIKPKPSCARLKEGERDRPSGTKHQSGDATGGPLRVEFRRSGGFAGQQATGKLDEASLSPEDWKELKQAITTSKFFDLPKKLEGTTKVADDFTYTITVSHGTRSHTIEVTGEGAPPALRPILHLINAKVEKRN
jgi:hypothetical protein